MKKKYFQIVALLSALFFISCDSNAVYNRGVSCLNKKCYSRATKYFSIAAKMGHVDAQVIMGNLYMKGIGVNEDQEKATELFQKAAEKGNSIAQYNLGYCYEIGYMGVIDNKSQAFNWYLKAAKQGDADAQNNVGLFYYYGIGVKQDYTQAFQWFLKSANGYCSSACKYVGRCYEYGFGVKTSYQKAIDWYNKANALALSEEGDWEETISLNNLKFKPFFSIKLLESMSRRLELDAIIVEQKLQFYMSLNNGTTCITHGT